ncbi:DUF72 domain-containing protein [Streptomyces sp. NPDC059506]|uniref:DUF72 domain-containing protein n=1 Tax=Streptomyces TaxID=1883 RepID=UPI0015FB5DCA|nr:DUF72 domain-containing protein [Streptomyces sp. SCUT-3]QMV20950.1 DUF72 domain-containing protein [Streptomyces sp. SCUT-3]
MARILTGTCSWTDPALVASGWYPPGTASDAEARLRYYASRFSVVEVDSTYYALPGERSGRLWAERTPDGFVFDVKAFSLLTGHPTRASALPRDLRPEPAGNRFLRPGSAPAEVVDELWRRFAGALAPLREAGRLGAVLLQFPPSLAPGPAGEAAVAAARGRCAGMRAAVEFRHPGWFAPDLFGRTLDLLRGIDAAFVAVDVAQGLPSSLPPVAAATSPELSVVRLHGRSPHWGTGSKEDRFRHRYTDGELAEWLPRVRALADGSAEVHVLFNNCCGDAAVAAAGAAQRLLSGEVPNSP